MASYMIARLGLKETLVLASLFEAAYVLLNVIPIVKLRNSKVQIFYFDDFVKFIIPLSQFLSGFGEALLWVGQGRYLSQCANKKIKGFYFSYFWLYCIGA